MNPILRLMILSFITAVLMIQAIKPEWSFTGRGLVFYWGFVLLVLVFTCISMQIKLGIWKWAMAIRKNYNLPVMSIREWEMRENMRKNKEN
jgi:hypothetical protein